MHLDELSKALSTELTSSINEKTDTKLASVLIVIFDSEPKILMTKKIKESQNPCRRNCLSWGKV